VSVADAYGAAIGNCPDRPWVGLCMVASIDGSTVVGADSSKLSSPTDTAVLVQLRRLADVIVVGAGTVREEAYGPPSKPGQRVGVVTNSGRLDFASALFTSGAGFVITSESGAPDIPTDIDVLRVGLDQLDLNIAMDRIAAFVGGATYIQVEGGAALNGSLLDADLIDEINLTISPATFGGAGPRLATGAPALAHRFEAAQIAIDDQSFVYTRWLRRRD